MYNPHYLVALADFLRQRADIKILPGTTAGDSRIAIFIDAEGDEASYELQESPRLVKRLRVDDGSLEAFRLSEELLKPIKCEAITEESDDEVYTQRAVSAMVVEYACQSKDLIQLVSVHEVRDEIAVEYQAKGMLSTRVATVKVPRDFSLFSEILVSAKLVRSGYQVAEVKGSGTVVIFDELNIPFSFDIESRSCECEEFQRQRSCAHSQLAINYIRNRFLYNPVRRKQNGITITSHR